METRSGWIKQKGMCPNCMQDIEMIAVQYEVGWNLFKRCHCRQINEVAPWPFKEGGALEATANDFTRLGFVIELDPAYEALLADQDAAYNDEVDHGWERSHI
jgi:hypothetical protein